MSGLTDVYDAYTAMPTWNKVETEGYSMTIDWAINNDWLFKSVTASARVLPTPTSI